METLRSRAFILLLSSLDKSEQLESLAWVIFIKNFDRKKFSNTCHVFFLTFQSFLLGTQCLNMCLVETKIIIFFSPAGYIRKSDLVVHERFHSKDKAFTCEICQRSFYQSGKCSLEVME
jgi:hypothetical protein